MPRNIPSRARNLVLPTAILLLAANLFAADHPGYTDTPFLPGSKWRVHDRDRPQPPLVAPAAKRDSRRPTRSCSSTAATSTSGLGGKPERRSKTARSTS